MSNPPESSETPTPAKWTPTPKAEWVKAGDPCISAGGMRGTVERTAYTLSGDYAIVQWENGHRGRVTITLVRRFTLTANEEAERDSNADLEVMDA